LVSSHPVNATAFKINQTNALLPPVLRANASAKQRASLTSIVIQVCLYASLPREKTERGPAGGASEANGLGIE